MESVFVIKDVRHFLRLTLVTDLLDLVYTQRNAGEKHNGKIKQVV